MSILSRTSTIDSSKYFVLRESIKFGAITGTIGYFIEMTRNLSTNDEMSKILPGLVLKLSYMLSFP